MVLDHEAEQIGGHALHPLVSTFVELSLGEQEALNCSLDAAGQLVPILRHGGLVLDGRARLRWCAEGGVEPRFEDLSSDAEPLEALLAANLQRRHLTRSQRAIAAARIATLAPGRPEKGQRCTFTIEEAAKRFGISDRLVKGAKAVLRRQVPGLVDVVERGLVSVTRAEVLTALEEEQLDSVIERVSRAVNAGDRATVIRSALETAGLEAAPGMAPNRRMKNSLEVLAAHVRGAEEPAGAFEAVLADLARQAGLLLREPFQSLVDPGSEDEVPGPPPLAIVKQGEAEPDERDDTAPIAS